MLYLFPTLRTVCSEFILRVRPLMIDTIHTSTSLGAECVRYVFAANAQLKAWFWSDQHRLNIFTRRDNFATYVFLSMFNFRFPHTFSAILFTPLM